MTKIAITIVHGTRPRNVLWMGSDSAFCRALSTDATTDVDRFDWCGRNSARARLNASVGLRAFLKTRFSQLPDHAHFVIAHSHGGNVALLAATRDDEVRRDLSGIACLSTPFLHCRARYLGAFGLAYLPALAILALVISLVVMSDEVFVKAWGWGFRHYMLAMMALATLLGLPLVFLVLRIDKGVAAASTRFTEATALTGLERLNLLLIRGVGDEASGFLTSAQFMAWMVSGAWRGISTFAGDVNRVAEYNRAERIVWSCLRFLGSSGASRFVIFALLVVSVPFMAALDLLSIGSLWWLPLFPVVGVIGCAIFILVLRPPREKETPGQPKSGRRKALLYTCVVLGLTALAVSDQAWWILAAIAAVFILKGSLDAWRTMKGAARTALVLAWICVPLVSGLLSIYLASPYPFVAGIAIPSVLGWVYLVTAGTELMLTVVALLVAPVCAGLLWVTTWLAYGPEAANAALRLEVAAEAMPEGTWTMTELSWQTRSPGWVHSSYDDPQTPELIRAWIQETLRHESVERYSSDLPPIDTSGFDLA